MSAPRFVTLFEARLLRILHALLGHGSLEAALPLVLERAARPATLTPACAELVADSLAKGCVQFLARAGGWRRERHLRGESAADGRLWERWPPAELPLAFSRHSLEFLLWLAASKPTDATPLELPDAELTPADWLLLFLAYERLRDTDVEAGLKSRPAFAQHGLIRLANPGDFKEAPPPDFAPWVVGPGTAIVEAIQPWLTDRWVALERGKLQIGDWSRMRDLGTAQESVLTTFVDAAEAAGRPDLVRFILATASAVLPSGATVAAFLGGLQGRGPAKLAERIAVQRAGLALPRFVLRLRDWHARALLVGFLDEGYAASQFWKAEWERFDGEALADRAAALVREVEPLTVR